MAELIYKTDFRNIYKVDKRTLSLPIPHRFTFCCPEPPDDVAEKMVWIEEGVLGMALYNVDIARRNEFTLTGVNEWIGDEIYVRFVVELPPDFLLYSPTSRYFQIANPFYESTPEGKPKISINFGATAPGVPNFTMTIMHWTRDETTGKFVQKLLYRKDPFALPRGRRFPIAYYLKRHETEGALRVWIDDVLLYAGENLTTREMTDRYHSIPGKIYHAEDDPTAHTIHIHDLEIWNGMPPTPIFPVWNTLALASGSAPLVFVVGTVIYEELVKLGVL